MVFEVLLLPQLLQLVQATTTHTEQCITDSLGAGGAECQ